MPVVESGSVHDGERACDAAGCAHEDQSTSDTAVQLEEAIRSCQRAQLSANLAWLEIPLVVSDTSCRASL